MKSKLEPTKNILRNFLEELENIKALRKNISASQPVSAFKALLEFHGAMQPLLKKLLHKNEIFKLIKLINFEF